MSNIVIVGGGTAGWLAALMISRVHSNHNVTVVESSQIPIIGAGEGSTGFLTDIIQGNTWDYGCNEQDFLIETGATVKLGIRHRDWRKLGHSYDAPLDSTNGASLCDPVFLHTLANDIPFHLASQNGYFMNESSSTFNNDLSNTRGHAYHFDAHRVGQYFKKVCSDAVTTIDARVTNVNLNSETGHVESIVLDELNTLAADFFIDCTGFARIFAKALDVKWHSYRDNLPVNAALPFQLPHGKVIDPVTLAWAQRAGWMWQIPTQERYGCGYVFSDDFVTPEEAQAEIESTLGREIEPIRLLKFDTGRLDKLWHKNVLFVGLSAAFAEPLEATSIHSTIMQLTAFVFDCLQENTVDTCNLGLESVYNQRMTKMYDDFKDFLVLHYMTERIDSDFWQYINAGETITDRVKDILAITKIRSAHPADFDNYLGAAGAPLWNWILAGLGYITKESAARELEFYSRGAVADQMWQIHEHSRKEELTSMIDNTEFAKNLGKYTHGNRLPK